MLQSLSIFRMREMEDARSLPGLAMEVYSDRMAVTAVTTDGTVLDRVEIPAALPAP